MRACLGMASCWKGNLSRARALLEESLDYWQSRNHTHWISGVCHQLATVAYHEGKFAEARSLCEEGLSGLEKVGDRFGAARVRLLSGQAAMPLGEMEEARKLLLESLAENARIGARPWVMWSLEALAQWEAAKGEARRAAVLLGAAEGLREILECRLRPVERPLYDRLTAELRAALCEEGWQSARAEGYRMRLEEAVDWANGEDSIAPVASNHIRASIYRCSW